MEDIKLLLHNGGIIIFPTDTAFAIGCRIDKPDAVDRLFTLRRRPDSMPMPVLVDSIDMALAYFDSASNVVRRLMKQYWPGGLTIIAPCKQNLIYSPIRGGGHTVGLRMPNHEVPLSIIKEAGVPIVGPSANFHGDPTPYRFKDLNTELMKLVDQVIPGECTTKLASTVVDCTSDPYTIIRQGAVVL